MQGMKDYVIIIIYFMNMNNINIYNYPDNTGSLGATGTNKPFKDYIGIARMLKQYSLTNYRYG
jgi:hypothetical protein